MSSSSESGDVPMVDAEEHLPIEQANGVQRNDQVMVNGAGSEDDLKEHNNNTSHIPGSEKRKISEKAASSKAPSEKAESSDEPTSHQPLQDVKMADSPHPATPDPKSTKSSDVLMQVLPTAANGLTVFKSGNNTPLVGRSRSASAVAQDNKPVQIGYVKGQPYTISNTNPNPKTPIPNGHPRSTPRPNGVLPSIEADAPDSRLPPLKKDKLISEKDALTNKAEDIREEKDKIRLAAVVAEVSSKSMQKCLRENWRTFLFDPPDETHIAFILRAGLKNSTANILQRVLKDDNIFKPAFLEAACQKPVMRKRVLEGVGTEEILSSIPQEKLDELVAFRIATAPANQLHGWLSKGKRMGFEEDDILSEQHEELFTPNIPPPPQYRPPPQQDYRSQHTHAHINNGMGMSVGMPLASTHTDPLLAEQNRQRELALQRAAAQRQALAAPQVPIQGNLGNHPGPLICNDCHHTFSNFPGYHHHITKKPCTKDAPPGGFKWSCLNCLQGFTTKQGNDYHRLKGVCTATDIVVASPAVSTPPVVPSNNGLPRPSSTPTVYVPPPVQGPPQSPWVSQQQQRPAAPPPYLPPIYGPQNRPAPSTMGSIPSSPPPRKSAPPVVTSIEVAVPSPKANKVPKPPLHTPTPVPAQPTTFHSSTTPLTTRKQAPRKDVRVDPSDLSPTKRAALDRDLAELDRKFDEGVADLPANMDPVARENRIQSLKNANSSRKSQVRKSYGVTLRMRDKDKQHRNSKRVSTTANNTGGSSSPSGSAATTPAPMAAPTPVARPRFDLLRNSGTSTPHAGMSAHGFSPVNTPLSSGFSPVNRANPNGASTPLTSSGFGVLRPPMDADRKRRHELSEHERRPGSGAGGYTGGIPANSVLNSGLAGMGAGSASTRMRLDGEDADERYKKTKVQVHVAGAQVDAEVASSAANGDTVMGDGADGGGGGGVEQSSGVVVIEDSEEEEEESQKEEAVESGVQAATLP